MSRVRTVEHKGKQITWLDFSGVQDRSEAHAIIEEAKGQVTAQPERSVYTLTDVSGSAFDAELARALWRLARANRPYVIAGAVVGIEGLQKDLFQLVTHVSRRPLKPFTDAEKAMDWLVTQGGED